MITAILALALAAQTPAAKGVTPSKAAPGPKAAAQSLPFQPKTMVDGETLQVILGQRAVFTVGDNGRPALEKVEEGKLAEAHPTGQVKESFKAPGQGLVAAALDGSAEKKATTLKVWNGGGQPLDFRAVALVLRGQKLTPMPVNICAVPAGQVRSQSWPAPIVAVGLARFTAKSDDTTACK
jgi:hypothetical protein